MPEAVGVIETLGFPAVLAAADAMVKAGRVTIVYYDIAESGEQVVAIRGPVSEVKPAMEAGIEAAGKAPPNGKLVTYYIVPNPPENVVEVLPIQYSERVEQFRWM
ncbi:MAG: carbon dioxide-concentrating mechanism protein CcmK [Synechococcales cyanobacterium C42_A2020_086]|jgi:microcompartment protein CcmL/EutN|nr:carbon dioxide-concentrating mechanism protein CcmK [Synechococcales cyanobacterium M58_A2018_015]MBF2074886.1 carbon dioxide-concentrating mechanism protein CcmK [Synechococcales cyanobacterium C42_A2020_086]